MGTNYYLRKPCPHCGQSKDDLHIGKSSGGWVFALHIIPEIGIHDLPDWRDRWGDGEIVNEYGDIVSPEEMHNIITQREGRSFEGREWMFYRDEAEFHAKNQSQRGPNGLLRHRLGRYCTKHGEGTWNCMPGDFS